MISARSDILPITTNTRRRIRESGFLHHDTLITDSDPPSTMATRQADLDRQDHPKRHEFALVFRRPFANEKINKPSPLPTATSTADPIKTSSSLVTEHDRSDERKRAHNREYMRERARRGVVRQTNGAHNRKFCECGNRAEVICGNAKIYARFTILTRDDDDEPTNQ